MLSIDVDLTVLLILLSSRCVVSESASVLELESPAFCLIVSCAEIYKYASDHQASSLIIRLLHKRGSTVATQQHSAPKERDEGEGFTTVIYFMCLRFRHGVSSSIVYGATLLEESDDIRDELYTTKATVGCLPSYLPTTHHATIFQSGVSYHTHHQPPRNNHPEILSFVY